ncbi:thioredoxin-like 3-2, chloroplastic isoform X2 [Benincasa hispida]|uniref:thioredoxin-like 3-2, chloroplastic isoform X2 n=1 Tax=Benincasa hispida TaxID=102211 RepID=UPI001901EE7F|nr:thioredoxin-like 3-2, chloroplastic isoform X2 [Benincasa hispida]
MVKALPLHLGIVKSFPKFDGSFDLPPPPQLPSARLAGSGFNRLPLCRKFPPLSQKVSATGEKTTSLLGAWTQDSTLQFRDESPVSIELKSICSELEFDKAIADAEKRNELVILVWMANWCRNYIYLKPQLERLAADYYPRLQFYCIDVNMVPHKLVVRAGLAMPAIQLWKDGKKQDEVIGLYKAYLVINDVQKMIERELTGE